MLAYADPTSEPGYPDRMAKAGDASNGRGLQAGTWLFGSAILASAFLLFVVQPMVGKRILPWFGGAAGVWILCLAFYQTTLFVGYAYAHLLTRFAPPRGQFLIHLVVSLAAISVMPALPGDSWRPSGAVNPRSDILLMLTANVALPFMLLASTGPLVQTWFARRFPGRSPYPLYAVSNIGAFAALLAYPFILEPWFTLSATSLIWTSAFIATVVVILACARLAWRAGIDAEKGPGKVSEFDERLTRRSDVFLWVGLSACAVLLLMGITNTLCLDIASVPFLWVLPLATYLLSFILCFAAERFYRPVAYSLPTVIAFALTLGASTAKDRLGWPIPDLLDSVFVQVPSYCALLFGACMLLHGELYTRRPAPHSLTLFYLCLSAGGALGGLFVGLAAPVLFNDYYELRLGLWLSLALFMASRLLRGHAGDWKMLNRKTRLAAPVVLLIAAVLLWPARIQAPGQIYKERNFYGVLRVTETGDGRARQRRLASGSTLHGLQFLNEGDRRLPTTYYGRATGIGMLLGSREGERSMRMGLIGLGVGTLASYGREGDALRYYEIDPGVVRIARDSQLFSFLSQSRAEVEIVLGDARLAIADEADRNEEQAFHLLVIDAFSSNAIPVHLLTVEAFRHYLAAMSPSGVLAVHVSNWHFDLVPLVARLGHEVNLHSLLVRTNIALRYQSQAAVWVFLSLDEQSLAALTERIRSSVADLRLPGTHAAIRQLPAASFEDAPLWSDDYSNLFGALNARQSR